jgi:hypothetical protein
MTGGLRKCIRPFCEQSLWAHDGMRCALIPTSLTSASMLDQVNEIFRYALLDPRKQEFEAAMKELLGQ